MAEQDKLQQLLEDPEVLAAADGTEAPQDMLPASAPAASMPGAIPPDLMAKLPALMGAIGPLLGADGGKKDEKTALLLALKPYMSPVRCDAIDKLIMLGRLGEVMRQLH